MKETIIRMERSIVRLEEALAAAALLLLVICLAFQIAGRFLINIPLDWTEELARVGQMWLVFLGAAIGARRADHFVVGLLMEWLERKQMPGVRAVVWLVDLVTIGFFVGLAWVSYQTTVMGAAQTMPTLEISVAWSYAALPVGCALMAFHFLVALFRPLDADSSHGGIIE